MIPPSAITLQGLGRSTAGLKLLTAEEATVIGHDDDGTCHRMGMRMNDLPASPSNRVEARSQFKAA